ncbi:MAG: deoxyribose-phosphate aldolase [Bacteroidales bacterium]|jgi:deoxyribose-phosphate aldolase|nr:deoxyribose-phosphate aldolase [Bacteroidales bacterium]
MFSFALLSGVAFSDLDSALSQILARRPAITDLKNELKELVSFIDFTSLEGSDNHEKIRQLCKKAILFGEKGLPYPATVCIFPPFIATAKQVLHGTPIRIATVAASFPSGQQPLSVKLAEIGYALQEGADEIEVVISRGTFLEKNYPTVYRELDAMRELTYGKSLKVILETDELQTPENIAKACEIAIETGADFIKTSTGKIIPSATEEDVFVILQVIREHYRRTGKKIGIKAEEGIADPEKALNYYWLVKEVLGDDWLKPDLFRIGANRLADRIVEIVSTD